MGWEGVVWYGVAWCEARRGAARWGGSIYSELGRHGVLQSGVGWSRSWRLSVAVSYPRPVRLPSSRSAPPTPSSSPRPIQLIPPHPAARTCTLRLSVLQLCFRLLWLCAGARRLWDWVELM